MLKNKQLNQVTLFDFFAISFLIILLTSCAHNRAPDGLKQKTPKQKKAELYYDYGTAALVKKEYTKALTNLKKAIGVIDDDSRYYNNLGMAYYFKKDLEKAIQNLKISLELDEMNSDARNNLASIYFNEGSYAKARTLYQKILTDLEYNKQFRTHYNLGLLDLKDRRKNRALEHFNKSVKINPNYCPAQFQLAQAAESSMNFHKAANFYQKANLGGCADNPTIHLHEAQALLKLQEQGRALLKFREIIDKFPESNEAIISKRQLKKHRITESRNDKDEQLLKELEKHKEKLNKTKYSKGKSDSKPAKLDF